MSYRWTRVPPGRPPLDTVQRRLLPVADLVMGLMWSRPSGLSLAEAWVTPATMVLGFVVATLGTAAALAAMFYGAGRDWIWVIAGLVIFGLALGAGIVAVYGIRQRLIH